MYFRLNRYITKQINFAPHTYNTGMIIIGITGTLGAGKGTVVEYLIEKHNFTHFSVREFIAEVITAAGHDVNRDTLTHTANALREQHGPGYIIEELYKKASKTSENCIIESIRTPGEITTLRKHKGFVLLAVDADIHIRYNRIVIRNSETDRIDLETFKSNEEREMHSKDPNRQNLSECIKNADYIIRNDGTIDELQQKTEEILNEILETPKQNKT
jgi:dephospho-CoA kinase